MRKQFSTCKKDSSKQNHNSNSEIRDLLEKMKVLSDRVLLQDKEVLTNSLQATELQNPNFKCLRWTHSQELKVLTTKAFYRSKKSWNFNNHLT